MQLGNSQPRFLTPWGFPRYAQIGGSWAESPAQRACRILQEWDEKSWNADAEYQTLNYLTVPIDSLEICLACVSATIGPWPRQTPSIRKSSSYFPTLRNLRWTMSLAITPAIIPKYCNVLYNTVSWLFLSEFWRAYNKITVNHGICMHRLET